MCEACDAARANPYSGRYAHPCRSCDARALARSTLFFECRQAREWTQAYRAAIARIFGEDELLQQEGHRMVVAWSKSNREGAAA